MTSPCLTHDPFPSRFITYFYGAFVKLRRQDLKGC